MIYYYIKRFPGGPWDEVIFPKEKAASANRFWINALLHGYLIERVG